MVKVEILYENPLSERMTVSIEGNKNRINWLENKVNFMLWNRGQWSVIERKVS